MKDGRGGWLSSGMCATLILLVVAGFMSAGCKPAEQPEASEDDEAWDPREDRWGWQPEAPSALEDYVAAVQGMTIGGAYVYVVSFRESTDREELASEIEKYLRRKPDALPSVWESDRFDTVDLGRTRDMWAYVLADLKENDSFTILVSDSVKEREKKIADLLEAVGAPDP